MGTSQLLSFFNFTPDYSLKCAGLYGKLLALFHAPLYVTKDVENAYCFVIIANDNAGNEHALSVYSGPSGPAIGGLQSANEAANALWHYIMNADVQPLDYEYEGYYMDALSKIHEGVKAGVPFYTETEMDDDEVEQANKELYN